MDLRLNGKIAVVTAASRGLGKAVAEALAKEGVNVAICARKKDLLDETAEFIRHEYEVEVLPVICDVSNPNAIDQFKEIVIEQFKTVHILFTNCASSKDLDNSNRLAKLRFRISSYS